MRLSPVLRVRGRCNDRVLRGPHPDGHERKADRGPPPGLFLEGPRPPLWGLPDAGIQAAARTQGALRHRRHGARLPLPERGGRRGRGGAPHPRGRRWPPARVVEGSHRRDRRCPHTSRRERLRVPPRPDLVLDLRVPNPVVHDPTRCGVRRGRARGHPRAERRLRRVPEGRRPRHVPRLITFRPRMTRGSHNPQGTPRSSGTSRRPRRSPTRTRGNESSGGPGLDTDMRGIKSRRIRGQKSSTVVCPFFDARGRGSGSGGGSRECACNASIRRSGAAATNVSPPGSPTKIFCFSSFRRRSSSTCIFRSLRPALYRYASSRVSFVTSMITRPAALRPVRARLWIVRISEGTGSYETKQSTCPGSWTASPSLLPANMGSH